MRWTCIFSGSGATGSNLRGQVLHFVWWIRSCRTAVRLFACSLIDFSKVLICTCLLFYATVSILTVNYDWFSANYGNYDPLGVVHFPTNFRNMVAMNDWLCPMESAIWSVIWPKPQIILFPGLSLQQQHQQKQQKLCECISGYGKS